MKPQFLEQKKGGPEIKRPNLTGVPAQRKQNFGQGSGQPPNGMRVDYSLDKNPPVPVPPAPRPTPPAQAPATRAPRSVPLAQAPTPPAQAPATRAPRSVPLAQAPAPPAQTQTPRAPRSVPPAQTQTPRAPRSVPPTPAAAPPTPAAVPPTPAAVPPIPAPVLPVLRPAPPTPIPAPHAQAPATRAQAPATRAQAPVLPVLRPAPPTPAPVPLAPAPAPLAPAPAPLAPAPAPPTPAPVPLAPAPAAPGAGSADLLPFGKNSAWYGSVHNGKVGSIYFGPGRIRLIHSHGPELSPVHDDGGTKKVIRYLIETNSGHDLHQIQNKLERHHRQNGDQPYGQGGQGNVLQIQNCPVYILSGRNAYSSIPAGGQQRHLYEIFLDTPPHDPSAQPAQPAQPMQYVGRHPSRGGIGKLPDELTDPAQDSERNLMKLTYAVKLAQRISTEMADLFLQGTHTTQAQSSYDNVTDTERQRLPDSGDPNLSWMEDILNNISASFPGDILAAGQAALTAEQAALTKGKKPKDAKQAGAKRFGGYLGNQALRAFLVIDDLGLNVDTSD